MYIYIYTHISYIIKTYTIFKPRWRIECSIRHPQCKVSSIQLFRLSCKFAQHGSLWLDVGVSKKWCISPDSPWNMDNDDTWWLNTGFGGFSLNVQTKPCIAHEFRRITGMALYQCKSVNVSKSPRLWNDKPNNSHVKRINDFDCCRSILWNVLTIFVFLVYHKNVF